MKKLFALLGAVLIFAGVKAQTQPAVKKETVVPTPPTTIPAADSLKTIKVGNAAIKQTANTIKGDFTKKTNAALPDKYSPAVSKPHKY